MYISRRQSQIFAVATLGLFFVVGAWFTGSGSQPSIETVENFAEKGDNSPPSEQRASLGSPTRESTNEKNEDSTESGRFTLQEFHRSETRDGKILWEIFGTNARYQPQQNAVAIEDCKLAFFSEDGRKIDIHSGTAVIFLAGTTLNRAELRDGVQLVYDNTVTVTMSEADYQRAENLVTSPAFVTVAGQWYEFRGTGLRAELDTEQLTLINKVESELHPNRRVSS